MDPLTRWILKAMSPRQVPVAILVFLVMSTVISFVQSQTFQYSRGWTNGRKRADAGPGASRTSTLFPFGPLPQSPSGTDSDLASSSPADSYQRYKSIMGSRLKDVQKMDQLQNGLRKMLLNLQSVPSSFVDWEDVDDV